MKVLVTGATGLIGRAVVQRLLDRGDRVRVLVRPYSDARTLEGLPIELVHGDITERGSVVKAAKGMEAVIHTAAFVSLYSRKLEEMRRVNATGVENVASAAVEADVRRLVHVSSIVAVGASDDGTPVDEQFPWPFEGIGIPYITTKHEAEQIVLRYNRPGVGQHGLEVVVVNPCLVVGAPDPRGVDPGHILRFLTGNLKLRFRGGANYVDLWDVADGILGALDRGRPGERYILGGEDLTLDAYYQLLSELSGKPLPGFKLPYQLVYGLSEGLERLGSWTGLGSPISRQVIWLARYRWFARSDKARRELGYKPTPIRQSILEAIQYYQAHPMLAEVVAGGWKDPLEDQPFAGGTFAPPRRRDKI